MAEGTGKKVGIGCCSAVAVLVCVAVMIGVIWGKKAWTYFQTAASEQSEMMVIVERWEGALDGTTMTAQSLSPENVDGFQRKEQTLDVDAPGFTLGATGMLDVYRSGEQEVRVWVTGTGKIDMAAAIEKVKAQIDERFSIKSNASFFMNGKGRLTYSGSPPNEQGLMVNTNDRIFLVQSSDKSADLQSFLIDYVEAGMQSAALSDDGVGTTTKPVEPEVNGSDSNEPTN